MIKLSLNELENSIYKAAESHFFAEGFCVSSMQAVSFLEAIGLNAVAAFLKFLENYDGTYPELKIIQTKENNLEIDFQNTSCISCAENIANFAVEKIYSHKQVFFKNTTDCIFLLPHLLKNHFWGELIDSAIHFQFLNGWQTQESSITAIISPKERYPKLIYQKPESPFQNQLSLSANEEAIPKYGIVCSQTAVELATHFQSNLQQGISIPKQLWDSLTKQAKKILVQNTVESREGAGESKNLIDPEDI